MRLIFLFLFIFASSLLSLIASASDLPIRIGINSSKSHDFYVDNNRLQGSYGEPLQCVLDNLAKNTQIQIVPVARLVALLGAGDIDIAVGLAQTEGRDKIGYYSDPVVEVPYALINGLKSFVNASDINGVRLATLRSSNMVPMIEKYLGIPHELASYDQVMKMVISKRVDGAIVPENVFNSMKIQNKDNLEYQIIQVNSVGFYISRNVPESQALLSKINASVSLCI
ncbi:substrate-binding periplasmic protein [Colwellia sp. MEBiC06753]